MYFNDPSLHNSQGQQYQQYLQMPYYPPTSLQTTNKPRRNSEWIQVASIDNVDPPKTVILDPYEELVWCGTENVSCNK